MGSRNPLSIDRPFKRWRTEANVMPISEKQDHFPKYHVIHCESSDKKARNISPFLVSRCLTETIGTGYKATKMASGDLLVEVKDKTQFQKLEKLVAFGDKPVTVSAHRTMNTVKGVVSDDDLKDLTNDELLAGWKDENVVHVQRIVVRRENKEIPTKHIIVTFGCSTLPQELVTGYLKLSVRPYIPNPRRCFKCQRFGHASQSCRGQLTCARCGITGHSADDDCKAEPHCANCDGEHAAYSRSCTAWKKEKEIITIKVTHNISFREARHRVSPFYATKSFAEVVQQGAAPRQHQVAAQATHSVLERPPLAPTAGAAKAAPALLNKAPPRASTCIGTSQGNGQTAGTPSTSGVEGLKASYLEPKPTTPRDRSAERRSNASHEAMDTTASQTARAAPKERRVSLDRSKKDKRQITGPPKSPVK